jgi:hypothetical protein
MAKGKPMKKILFLVVAIILVFVVLYFVNKGKEKTQPEATQDNSKKRIQKVLDRAGGYTNYYTTNQNKFGPDFEPQNKQYVETLKNRAVEFGRTFEQELGIDSVWDQNRTGVKTTWGDVTQEEFNIARRIIIENKYPNWKA